MIDTTKGLTRVNYAGSDIPFAPSTEEKYLVTAIDYDGTILKQEELRTGDTFTLPAFPTHTGLTAQEWSSLVTITNNTITVGTTDIVVGVVYETTSGLSEFDIELTKATGLTVTLKMSGGTGINWGDGTTDTNTSHTYSNYGEYTITTDHTTMNTQYNSGLFGQQYEYSILKRARLNNVTEIKQYAFQNCLTLTEISMSNDVAYLGSSVFTGCNLLKGIVIPTNATFTGYQYEFSYCRSLESIVLPSALTQLNSYFFNYCESLKYFSLPSNITTINNFCFHSCNNIKKLVIPEGVTYLGTQAIISCNSLEDLTLPSTITSWGSSCISSVPLKNIKITTGITAIPYISSTKVKEITIPSGVTSVEGLGYNLLLEKVTLPNSLVSLGNLGSTPLKEITIPSGVTSISSFAECYLLKEITIPSGVTSIPSQCFRLCKSLLKCDFSSALEVPTLASTNCFEGVSKLLKIIVPDALYEDWIVETNWTTYADYIYKASEVQ